MDDGVGGGVGPVERAHDAGAEGSTPRHRRRMSARHKQDARDAEIGRLKETVGDLTMATELLEAKIERLEVPRPLARRRSRR